MKKCTELKACNLRGSSLTIFECGGVMLKDGQCIIVLESIVQRMLKQYPNRLVEVKNLELDKLKGGHYQLLGHQKVETKTKDMPKKSDKSMFGKKKVSKKKVSKKKA